MGNNKNKNKRPLYAKKEVVPNESTVETEESTVETEAPIVETKEPTIEIEESTAPVTVTETPNTSNDGENGESPTSQSDDKVITPTPKEEEELENLDDNGIILKNAIDEYLKAVVSVPEAKSRLIKEAMIKTIIAIFKRPDLTQASADVVNKAFKTEVYCGELPLLRGLSPSLHGVVSFIHAKLAGVNITIDAPIGNAEKLK